MGSIICSRPAVRQNIDDSLLKPVESMSIPVGYLSATTAHNMSAQFLLYKLL